VETFWGGLKKSENIPIEPDPGNAGEGRNVSWGFGFRPKPLLFDQVPTSISYHPRQLNGGMEMKNKFLFKL